MITLFATSAGSSNACVTEPFVWFCSRNGNGISGKPCEPRHLAWIWVWLLQQPWNHTNIKSWKHMTYENLEIHEIHCIDLSAKDLTYLKNRVLRFTPLNFISWKPKRVREQQLGFPDFANFGCFYLAFTCNFGQPISMIVLEYHDASFLWNKLKKQLVATYIKPTPHHAVPFRFQTLSFLPCSVLLSEARLWKKASILASLIQGVGQRSTEVSRKDFSSLIKLNSKQFDHVWISSSYIRLYRMYLLKPLTNLHTKEAPD